MSPIDLLSRIRIAVGVVAIGKGIALAILGVAPQLTVLWFGFATCVALGVRSRFSAYGLVIVGSYLFTLGLHSNQFFLLLLLCFLIAASDSERLYAAAPGRPGPIGVQTPLLLMKYQLSIVYGFAALAKINDSWISGRALEFFFDRAMWTPPLWFEPIWPTLAVSVIGVELGLAGAPWVPRLRRPAVVIAAGLHLGMLPIAVSWLNAFELMLFAAMMLILLAAFAPFPAFVAGRGLEYSKKADGAKQMPNAKKTRSNLPRS